MLLFLLSLYPSSSCAFALPPAASTAADNVAPKPRQSSHQCPSFSTLGLFGPGGRKAEPKKFSNFRRRQLFSPVRFRPLSSRPVHLLFPLSLLPLPLCITLAFRSRRPWRVPPMFRPRLPSIPPSPANLLSPLPRPQQWQHRRLPRDDAVPGKQPLWRWLTATLRLLPGPAPCRLAPFCLTPHARSPK